jgi:DNA-binding transcriptional LysR family regulator
VCATIDLGHTAVTRALAAFLRAHPGVTGELSYSARPLQLIEEGYDVGVIAGRISAERLIVRPAGSVKRVVVAWPARARAQQLRAAREPSALMDVPWAVLSGVQSP